MPYVEGFGTYPFGEEWLFDAVIRSYLPVLEVAERLTMTITPVLADQLEDPGVKTRLRRFLADWRIAAAAADIDEVDAECREACVAEHQRYSHALELLDADGGDPLRPFQRAVGEGRIALATSAATHAVLPLLGTREALHLQLDAGIRSHRRRFGWEGGFWLPECAYAPGLEWRLAEEGVNWFCVDQSRHRPSLEALAPIATEAGPVALPIDWEAIQWLWSLQGYPSDPAHAQFAGESLRGVRIWKVGGGGYDPVAGAAAARRQAGEFLAAAACSSSRSTPSCSATGGRRARSGSATSSPAPMRRGCACSPCPRRSPSTSRSSCRSAPRPGVRRRTCAPGTRRLWPTSPGARGDSSCACCAPSPAACVATPPSAPRASYSPSSRATGPSSTSGARPATTPTSAPFPTPKLPWRP